MPALHTLARYTVFAAFSLSVLVASASWLVRARRVSPFGALGRTLRAVSDPLIRPVVARLVLLSLMDWAVRTFQGLAAAATGGPRAMLAFLIMALYSVVFAALLVRVIGAWFGVFRYSRWMRPAYVLTDWLVEPIRRVLPPMGALDWSPLVACLVLWLLKQLLLSVLLF